MLIHAELDLGKWAIAFPQVRELLSQPGTDADHAQRLRWLLKIGEQALSEGNLAEANHAIDEAQPYLTKDRAVADAFEQLRARIARDSVKP